MEGWGLVLGIGTGCPQSRWIRPPLHHQLPGLLLQDSLSGESGLTASPPVPIDLYIIPNDDLLHNIRSTGAPNLYPTRARYPGFVTIIPEVINRRRQCRRLRFWFDHVRAQGTDNCLHAWQIYWISGDLLRGSTGVRIDYPAGWCELSNPRQSVPLERELLVGQFIRKKEIPGREP